MSPLTLTILGASPAAPNPGGACSGYLLRQGEAAVLMDCGPGTAGRIPLHVPVNRLGGVVRNVEADGVMALVEIEAGPYLLAAVITRDAVEELRLAPGVPVVATIKATSVMVGREGGPVR